MYDPLLDVVLDFITSCIIRARANTRFQWSLTGETGKMDVQNIMTHELGHFCGLKDLYNDADYWLTMYGYSDYGLTYARTLGLGDINGLKVVYGAQKGHLFNNPPLFLSVRARDSDMEHGNDVSGNDVRDDNNYFTDDNTSTDRRSCSLLADCNLPRGRNLGDVLWHVVAWLRIEKARAISTVLVTVLIFWYAWTW